MKNTLRSKTLTATLEEPSLALFARVADPENLPQWHSSFCQSMHKENGLFIAESPRGRMPVRIIRNDHAALLDLMIQTSEGTELLTALRILPNGQGSEITLTLIQPTGLSDAAFHEHVRWAEVALRNLRKLAPVAQPPAKAAETPEPPTTVAASPAPESGKKVFVGNLPFDWSEDLLRGLCAELGTIVNVTIARFRNQGRSRGFGFVEMSSEAEAQAVITKLHESLAGGRKIMVRLARTKDNSSEKTAETPQPAAVEPTASVDKQPIVRHPHAKRTRSTGQRPPALARRSRNSLPRSPRPSQDIQNKSGYEYFPRRAAGNPQPDSSLTSQPEPSREPAREASPYFDDAGEIQRPLRRRGR